METITCQFSCDGCGLRSHPVEVRAREQDEDIIEWMENTVGRSVAFEHLVMSPTCRAQGVRDLKIPLPPEGEGEDKWVGMPGSSAFDHGD